MVKWLLFSLCGAFSLFGKPKIPEKYCVVFGKSTATIEIVEYFSFGCPQCVSLFKKDFSRLKEKYIDSGKVRWIFHPHPFDFLTIQGMVCLSRLNEKQKQSFLQVLMEECEDVSVELAGKMMERAMEVFKQPIKKLQDIHFIEKSKAFKDAYSYASGVQKIEGIPAVEINGILLKEFPSAKAIEKKLMNLEGK